MEKRAKTTGEYIANCPANFRDKLRKLRQAVRRAAPEAEEIISYGMPALRFHGILLYYAAHKEHIGFYAYSSAIKAFKKDLAGYSTSKAGVRFSIDEPIPFSLVTKMTKFRVKENMKKASKKK